MFGRQGRACYPENSQSDGCFPDNDATPSRFKCWEAGTPSPSDLLRLFSPQGQTEPAPRRGSRRGRPGRGQSR